MGAKARECAAGKPCTLRFEGCRLDTTTTVLAHVRTANVGWGKKPPDSMGVFACAHCHDILDGRKKPNHSMMDKELQDRVISGMAETHPYLLEAGAMVLL